MLVSARLEWRAVRHDSSLVNAGFAQEILDRRRKVLSALEVDEVPGIYPLNACAPGLRHHGAQEPLIRQAFVPHTAAGALLQLGTQCAEAGSMPPSEERLLRQT